MSEAQYTPLPGPQIRVMIRKACRKRYRRLRQPNVPEVRSLP